MNVCNFPIVFQNRFVARLFGRILHDCHQYCHIKRSGIAVKTGTEDAKAQMSDWRSTSAAICSLDHPSFLLPINPLYEANQCSNTFDKHHPCEECRNDGMAQRPSRNSKLLVVRLSCITPNTITLMAFADFDAIIVRSKNETDERNGAKASQPD